MPEHFEVVCVQVRDPAKGQAYADRWQLPVVNALPELLETGGTGVRACIGQPTRAAEVIMSVASTGMPVLTETPPGQTVAELERLTTLTPTAPTSRWRSSTSFQPLHAARIALARDGLWVTSHRHRYRRRMATTVSV